MSKALSGIVAEHIRAVNAFDTDAIVATFAEDAYVNDNRREIVRIEAVRRWVEKEMVGDKVTIKVREVLVSLSAPAGRLYSHASIAAPAAQTKG